jgi:hypothetical protein
MRIAAAIAMTVFNHLARCGGVPKETSRGRVSSRCPGGDKRVLAGDGPHRAASPRQAWTRIVPRRVHGAMALLDAGATLPADPAHRAALVDQATSERWTKLLPRLGRHDGPAS